ncbi:serine/threonine-protein kinase ppk30 [Polychytrium aggregatum]|uniref:serine/threonine-protein kinase ppk30 n=1 Tax=Polychytrium aggregatum TaxID=110093 RepID=UPI0022FE05FE|nr:serine/threonine-protein kinase ppk30 [Polychytrium aggregatum]KAI9201799.1 serine/threonine-protein kinase ppk30 [Polychytrium aggregatum]
MPSLTWLPSLPSAVSAGSFPPGTMLSINGSVAMVERFLAEGGFAHVYLVSVSNEPMCVKRIACMDESTLAEFQKEVDFMKKLNGHRNIVQFAGACSHPLKHGGYEMLILMEYCPGGRLVDYLNARLPRRLNEMEVLTIFSDICEGVAYMHMQSPVIVHRDLKVENVLVSKSGTYKLCDFGSATTQLVPPGAQLKAQEIQKLEDEISKFTTLQYRSPEMCDLYQKRGLTEKLDIWALGVLLYKLCYYTTPFEDSGKMAIINVRYSFPTTPVYSPAIQKLIGKGL